jgi:hypothetical protein
VRATGLYWCVVKSRHQPLRILQLFYNAEDSWWEAVVPPEDCPAPRYYGRVLVAVRANGRNEQQETADAPRA